MIDQYFDGNGSPEEARPSYTIVMNELTFDDFLDKLQVAASIERAQKMEISSTPEQGLIEVYVNRRLKIQASKQYTKEDDIFHVLIYLD